MDDKELRRLPLLSELDEQQIARMRDTRRTLHFSAGQTVFHMGERCSNFYYLDAGAMKLFRISPAGQEKIVEIIRPGQTFAEAVMFFAQPLYPVNAEALEDTTLTAFDCAAFMSMLKESTDTCIRLLGTLSMRLHHRINEIEALSLQNSMLRVVHYLLTRLDDSDGEAGFVELEASKKVIAARLSIQPETFSRVLHALAESGAIAVDGRRIQITNASTLRQFAGTV